MRACCSMVGAFALVSMCVVPAVAEPTNPKDFYKKDFAEVPQVGGADAQRPEVAVPRGRGRSASRSRVNDSTDGSDVAGGGDAASAGALMSSDERPGARVVLYVNSAEKGHFEGAVRKAFELARKNRRVVVSEIYHIGDYRNVSASIKEEARARQVYIGALTEMPPSVPATTSPTWLIRDAAGEHIVEGVLVIEKCLSTKGEYQEPQRSMFEPPPTATVVVKEF